MEILKLIGEILGKIPLLDNDQAIFNGNTYILGYIANFSILVVYIIGLFKIWEDTYNDEIVKNMIMTIFSAFIIVFIFLFNVVVLLAIGGAIIWGIIWILLNRKKIKIKILKKKLTKEEKYKQQLINNYKNK